MKHSADKKGDLSKREISISLVSDHNYRLGLLVTIKSIVTYAAHPERLRFHVLDTGLTSEDRYQVRSLGASVHFHNVDVTRFKIAKSWRGGWAAYARLMLQDILVDEDWTIYTDIDTLWMRDVEDLWQERDESKVLCAVPDGAGSALYSSGDEVSELFNRCKRKVRMEPNQYFCSGLLVMNLRKLRELNFSKMADEFLARYPQLMSYPDQNLYNWYFAGTNTKLLEIGWGLFPEVCANSDKPMVIHYAKQAPWKKKVTLVNWKWWVFLHNYIGKGGIEYYKRKFIMSVMANPIGFEICYGWKSVLNPRSYNKRRRELLGAC